MNHRDHRANPGAFQVGKKVLDLLFAPRISQSISIRRGSALPMQIPDVFDT
jgi:hypothetical protein